MKLLNPQSGLCNTCKSFKNFPKYSCKTCSHSFTSNFKQAREFDRKYLRRKARRERLDSSIPQLRTLYSRIKEKYFEGNYVPHPDLVSFIWKRGSFSGGGVCRKTAKLIKIGKRYRLAFDLKTKDPSSSTGFVCPDNFNDTLRKDLIKLMIHEMIHLRLAHHKKSFKQKETEVCSLVRDEHMIELYDGLIRQGSINEAESNQNDVSVQQNER